DALAQRIGARGGRLKLLIMAELIALWPVIAMWGHPEDVMALGLGVFAMLAVSNHRTTLAGWLLGLAIAMQLFVVLLVPIFLGVTGIRVGRALLARACVIPGTLLIVVMVPDFNDAVWTLANQPAYPTVLHPTPWIHLAPHITRIEVSNGPVHLLPLGIAAGIGVLAHRNRGNWAYLFWLAAVAMGVRCLFEAVMAPYYVMPAVAIAFAVAATQSRVRFLFTVATGIGLTVMTFSHSGEWTYWSEVVALLGTMFLLSRPTGNPAIVRGVSHSHNDVFGSAISTPITAKSSPATESSSTAGTTRDLSHIDARTDLFPGS
ncbi:MAG: hypothetical protein ACREP9_12395, partial [Candidatus Dormibacteraceae bacterium]